MKFNRVYVRFFKSFNFDYERRAQDKPGGRAEWEVLPVGWYPHVRLNVDPQITAIVGANESGKSHLLDAVECITGKRKVSRSDFCRHSQLYSVEANELRIPDVGAVFELTLQRDVDGLAEIGVTAQVGDTFLFMRPGVGSPFITKDEISIELDTEGKLGIVEGLLPRVLRFSTSVAIPDTVPIAAMWGGALGGLADRRRRSEFLDAAELAESEVIDSIWPEVGQTLLPFLRRATPAAAPSSTQLRLDAERSLARQLLIDVARIEVQIFHDLQVAVNHGKEGEVSGIENKINQSLARHLNMTRWWSQDKDFQLRVTVRERELAFTIRDRTGTEYSFAERSRGLTHFLAYFVQLRAHQPDADRSEILLMDEPDAYLSNMGQQDLLRVLENYAVPDNGLRSDQVMYVTHSPFLINKNAATRLRVLDKGSQEDGTRVVKDVARTHYEPLRSSLGSYVAETAFIGGKNLIVEGMADQVILAGMSNVLRSRLPRTPRLLDLNEVTIVPAGSADSVPYIAYLARGRDPIKPPCVVLLDGDESGRQAVRKILRSEANRKPVIDRRFVVSLDDWAKSHQTAADSVDPSSEPGPNVVSSATSGVVTEIEDLIPIAVAVRAARAYAGNLLGVDEAAKDKLKESELKARVVTAGTLWDALQPLFKETFGDGMDKVGFAREVVAYVKSVPLGGTRPTGLPALEANFVALLSHLTDLLDSAATEEANRRRSKRVDRIVRGFLDDFQDGATRTVADSRLKEIESSLDDSQAHDTVKLRIAKIRRDHSLRLDPTRRIDNYAEFGQQLLGLIHVERLSAQDSDDD